MNKPKSPADHLAYIDALRGWAILGVLAYHIQCFRGLPTGLVDSLLSEGWRGVRLFFVVSAFTLMRSLHHRSAARPEPWAAFFIRRFFRIAPMFYVGIIFYLFWNGCGPRADIPDGMPSTAVLQTLFLVHGWRPDTLNAVVPGGWSIAAEAMFYLLLPPIFRHVLNFSHSVALLAASWALALLLQGPGLINWLFSPWAGPKYDYVMRVFVDCWPPVQLPVFACGIVLYFLLDQSTAATPKRLPYGGIFVGAMLCLGGTGALPSYIGFSIGTVLLIWGLAQKPVKLLVNPFLCFLGKISFSIYVIHFIALELVTPLARLRHLAMLPSIGQFGVLLAALLALVAPLGALTYFLVESPGQELGRRLTRRLYGSRPLLRAAQTGG